MRRFFNLKQNESEFVELLRHLTEFSRETRTTETAEIKRLAISLFIKAKVPLNEGDGLDFYRNEWIYGELVKADHKTGIREWERRNTRTPFFYEERRLYEGFSVRVDGFTLTVSSFNDEREWVNWSVYEGISDQYWENYSVGGKKVYRMKLRREQLNKDGVTSELLRVIK